jgi:RNA polymerase sigma-70 factor, ECF subfamily
MTTSEETLLIKEAKKGNLNAFELLIVKHQKKVYNIALHFSKNHDDALDLSQDTFLKAFKNLPGFKENSSFSTWIYQIATNLCIDAYRKNSHVTLSYIDEDPQYEEESSAPKIVLTSSFLSPEDAYLKAEFKNAIHHCLDQLPLELKMILVLKDIHDFQYAEIAHILQIQLGTVKSRISRARTYFKKILSQNKELFNRVSV